MSHGLPDPPPEVPVDKSLDGLAPGFVAKVNIVLAKMELEGFDPVVAESLRTDERQAYLYGFGRDYDDGRGIVTNSPTGNSGWHKFGLAVDIVSESEGWDAPSKFWNALGRIAVAEGLSWGGNWTTFKDLPHVQSGPPMRQSPSPRAAELLASGGLEALWDTVGAS